MAENEEFEGFFPTLKKTHEFSLDKPFTLKDLEQLIEIWSKSKMKKNIMELELPASVPLINCLTKKELILFSSIGTWVGGSEGINRLKERLNELTPEDYKNLWDD
jgi:hypothetical protein